MQYEVSADEQVKTVSANSPPISATPPDTPPDTPPENTSAERLILTPEDIPEELRASDDIFYNDDSIESEFYYVTDDEESVTPSQEVYDTSNTLSEQPVSYYYKDLPDSYSNHGESVSNSYLSYPSYPPLAPAPPAPPAPSQDSPPTPPRYGFRVKSEPQSTERIYASQDPYLNEVSTPSKPQSKRENQQGPIISYKSAYSSQDLDKSYKSAYTSQDISAVPSKNPSQPQINEPQTLLAPDGSVFYLEGVSEEQPPQESHEVYKNPATPSPIYYKYPSSTPDYSRQETLIEAPSAPKVPPTKVPQPVVYYREVQSTTTPAPAPLPLQDNPDAFSGEPSYEAEDEVQSEAIETKVKRQNLVSFDIPPSMTFEIPQEFRTFLNTPPKWINLENW